jgi:acetate kinase
MPLRKYGFHGLSYASIVASLAQHLGKKESEINIVVAHLGSGASSACIKGGRSLDTCELVFPRFDLQLVGGSEVALTHQPWD